MFDLADARNVPTTVQSMDVIQYSQEYEWVKVCRGMRALNIIESDDKSPMKLAEYQDFRAFCRLIAFTNGLTIDKLYAERQANQIWRCRLGVHSGNITPMPICVGDVIRFVQSSQSLEFLRKGVSVYCSTGMRLNMETFGYLSRILASCRGLEMSGINIVVPGNAWSFTFLSRRAAA